MFLAKELEYILDTVSKFKLFYKSISLYNGSSSLIGNIPLVLIIPPFELVLY
jgi:hypothetical protein